MRNRKWNFSHQTFPENTTVSHFDCLFGFKFLPFCFIRSSHADTTLLLSLQLFYVSVDCISFFIYLCVCVCAFVTSLVLLFAFHLYIFANTVLLSWRWCLNRILWSVSRSFCFSLFLVGCLCWGFRQEEAVYLLYALNWLCMGKTVHCSVQCHSHASHSGTCTSFDFVINVKRSFIQPEI